MRALVYDGNALALVDRVIPEPPPGEALIQVRLAGICNTDLEIMRGYMGFQGVLGHEFVGEVVACEDGAWVGQRVVGEINCACGACAYCRHGVPSHCPNRTTLGIDRRDGALAEYLALPCGNLHGVADVIADEEAVFVEPLAAAVEIFEQVHIKPTERVIVLGDGKLGLLVAQVLSLAGCDITCIGHHQAKLRHLAKLGIAACLPNEIEMGEADCVIECTGRSEGFALARKLLHPRGRLVLKSTYHGDVAANLTSVVVDEIELVGSRCGPFAPALRLLERQLVQVRSLIDSVYGLDDGIEAFERAATRGALKVLVRMTG